MTQLFSEVVQPVYFAEIGHLCLGIALLLCTIRVSLSIPPRSTLAELPVNFIGIIGLYSGNKVAGAY